MKNIAFLSLLIVLSLNITGQNDTPETVFIEGGTFKMGVDESQYYDEYPTHLVRLNDFYIGKFEVTIEEYKGFCKGAGLRLPEGEPRMPASNVSWEEAVMYCNWLSRLNRLDKCYTITRDEKTKSFSVKYDKTANGYRLPTEAEWEFAAKGGNSSKSYAYSGSNDAIAVAWFSDTGKSLSEIGLKQANELDLFDMSGNCQEWCYDTYLHDYYKKSPKENPVCEESSIQRVSRGGNFNGHTETLRISKRFYNEPNFKDDTMGFRIAKNK